ncbi:MAG TPA: carboxymuconolactone decarboxylase family protein, partial [Caulobacteraceae bacterium]
GLSDASMIAARGAAAVMAQNNIYFRAIDLLDDPALAREPSHLRMGLIAKPGVDPLDFHLWTLAVSAIHGCEACLKAQASELRRLGASPAAITAALRTAALIHAASRVLAAEAAAKE